MHDETTPPFSDETGRHSNVIGMKVGDNEGVNGRLLESEIVKTLTDGLSSWLPIGATVDQKKPTVGFDRVGVDPGW
jgi:hypothetical protein